MEEIAQQIPMRRMAEVDEISRVVLFVASRLNTYISGQNIVADGGFVNI
jgi:NAD(P)-dependent dehydrogenase (short-subunit alcohol dehydrogenase family)